MGSGEFLNINFFTALFTLANTIALFLVLKKFLFKPVLKMIDDRQKEIDDLYADAEQAKQDAEASKLAYEDKLAGADEEARAVVRRAMQKANAMSDDILRDTGKKVDAMMEKAKADIAQEEKRARNELKDEIAQMSLDIAQKVVSQTVDEDAHRHMIDQFIAEMGEESNA